MKTSSSVRPVKSLTLFIAVILFVSLMATPVSAATCPENIPSEPITLAQGLVITELNDYGLGDKTIHVVIDGGFVVTMDVPTWQLLTDNDPEHPGYMMYYDSVFNLWQAQRAADWVSRNMRPDPEHGPVYCLTDLHDLEFRTVCVTTAGACRCPIEEILRTVTRDETVEVVPVSTVTFSVYRADGAIHTATVEISQATSHAR